MCIVSNIVIRVAARPLFISHIQNAADNGTERNNAIFGGVLYMAYEQWASRNSNDNIGHDAHFFGAIAGMLVTIVLEPRIFSYFIEQLFNNSPYW